MDQQGKCNKAQDILDFSVLDSGEATNLINDTNNWLLNLNDDDRWEEPPNKKKGFAGAISEEELKIRSEVEMEIEKNLEEEIKDGICHLALRLQRLYQHQKERRSAATNGRRSNNNKAFCEVNINIKMEGGTKIEIKETKKPAPERGCPNWTSSGISERSYQQVTKMASNTKKFDWAKSLRSSAGPALVTNKNSGPRELGWKV
ncbi:hypothetical protein ACFX13_019369 [Malus domestica]|uniref:uncharacterized protein LOC126604702 n=1 Tax=Malus sylvestris TaxID=3752 RepID=UPI0010AAD908|nr:uncharacterized protein LOC103422266 [Malus domestica]XP_050127953.1 uncharacterized protein LOC126604702 [Malus sylvestris]